MAGADSSASQSSASRAQIALNSNPGLKSEEIDHILAALLEARGKHPKVKVKLPTHNQINALCHMAMEVFLSQDALLDLEAPMNIVGDIHGQYSDLLQFLERGGFPPHANYLFLGDYVDRGQKSLEVFLLLLCFKVRWPENFFMLRGNHECAAITRIYGFYDECKRKLNVKMWKMFIAVFDRMPFAATIDDRIFCVHGGLSPEVTSVEDINKISRPTDVPERGILCDLLWGDPAADMVGWAENDRGVSYLFGLDVVEAFLRKHEFDMIVRAHQVVQDGFEFFGQRKLITLFSAPNYCGEFGNAGAMMHVADDLSIFFTVLRPPNAPKPTEPPAS